MQDEVEKLVSALKEVGYEQVDVRPPFLPRSQDIWLRPALLLDNKKNFRALDVLHNQKAIEASVRVFADVLILGDVMTESQVKADAAAKKAKAKEKATKPTKRPNHASAPAPSAKEK